MRKQTVGIVGGGQLARMLALAGYPLGIRFKVLDPKSDACAGLLCEHICAPYDDLEALSRLAEGCDVVTYEFENVSAEALDHLAARVQVYPPISALKISRDRLTEKDHFRRLDIPTPLYLEISSYEDLLRAPKELGWPFLVKTRRFGYDGKGQFLIHRRDEIDEAWRQLEGQPIIAESFVPFDREVSIIAVRSTRGEVAFYPLTENRHLKGILRQSTPRPNDPLTPTARSYAERLLESFDYVGVLALELFEVKGRLIANEMAPRVHNSGHWTIDGAETSQFENHLRVILGYPLGLPDCKQPTVMINLIGSLPSPCDVLAIPGAHLHDYDKAPRPGRKVGHINLTAPTAEALEARLQQLLHLLP